MMTPGVAAKQWAKEHPAFVGLLNVVSLTPAGKGGWMTKRKTTHFVVSSGLASLVRWTRSGCNGFCRVCGNPFHATILQQAYAPDPEGDTPAVRCQLNNNMSRICSVSKYAFLHESCSSCIGKLGAVMKDPSPYGTTDRCYHKRAHPASTFEPKQETLDIRQAQ